MEPALFQITLKVFLLRDGRRGPELLVLRDRKSGFGDLPGGRLGPGEIYRPWVESVHRELAEELGPEIRYSLGTEPVFVFPHFIQESGYEALGIAYEARLAQDSGSIRLSDEHEAQTWVELRTYDPATHFTAHLCEAVRRFQQR